MEIGIIIFVIWTIVSIISGIVEKNSKNKKKDIKQRQPQTGNPVQRQTTEKTNNAEQELRNLVSKYESYKEKAETSTTDRMSNHYAELAKKIENQLKYYNIDVEQPKINRSSNVDSPQDTSSVHENQYINQQKEKVHKTKSKRQQEAINSLLEYNNEEKASLTKLQRENIAKVEEEAEEIIHNVQLSERTRRSMVKQLYLNSKHKMNDEAINIDENQVVNGIIWSEILTRPKELK
nr:hypothetical protein [Mammaliicoccus sp. Marseille-Q6498]